jgi:Holliday junction resolvasome RuvABC DNA-binding subunit
VCYHVTGASAAGGGPNVREADVTTLVNMGYARQQAIQTLQMFGG